MKRTSIFLLFVILFVFCNTTCKPIQVSVPKIPEIVSVEEMDIITTGLDASFELQIKAIDWETFYLNPPQNISEIPLATYYGSGFCIKNKEDHKVIVTAFHNIKDFITISANIYKYLPETGNRIEQDKISLKVKKAFPQEDIALLEVSKEEDESKLPNCVPIAASNWSPSLEDNLWVFGFMTGWQRTIVVKPAIMQYDDIPFPVFRLFPMAQRGDSGGLVMNKNKEAVGIVLAISPGKHYSIIEPITMLELETY